MSKNSFHPTSHSTHNSSSDAGQGFVRVRGAREHNLKNVSLDIPRNAFVVFTGISGSGKSSLAFGTLYAEAQRRYLESVSPYARRLFNQMSVPEVDEIDGLPPAVALQQQRGSVSTRSTVGSVTTLSNLLRMLYSRAGDYPFGQSIIYAEAFSPNTPEGACPECHGIGRVFDATEKSMVPDDTLTIRERAIAAWPTAWQGQNLREILMTLGYDVDKPWRDLPKKDRDWILFTEEQPTVPVYSGFTAKEMRQAMKNKVEPSYMGTFTGAKKYVLQTFANSQSQMMKKRVSQFLVGDECPLCHGKRLRKASLSVKFAGLDITELSRLSFEKLDKLFRPFVEKVTSVNHKMHDDHPEKRIVTQRIATDLVQRIEVLLDLGLGYLTPDRNTPTLSPGELQRLRLATQVRSNLFGVIYVLDEPSAGLHPADTQSLIRALDKLKASGNSLFVVEHELDVIRHADWIVDVGPAAGEKGGHIVYNGPVDGIQDADDSVTKMYLRNEAIELKKNFRQPAGWINISRLTKNNLHNFNANFPLGVFCSITGVSGSGKSTLVSQALTDLLAKQLGQQVQSATEENDIPEQQQSIQGKLTGDLGKIKRMVVVDQKPIGRTPRSNLATYTGLFDNVRKIFAETPMAKKRRYDAGRFSFNVPKGRCPHCSGEGFVMVELLFLPSVYTPCPTCNGSRYNAATLEVKYNDLSIADVLGLTVDHAWEFFNEDAALRHALDVLRQVGLGYLRLGQSATELSGGEAQRIKLATELQRIQHGNTFYILDEPTTGLHPSDVEKLMTQLNLLADAGNTVIAVEHDMQVVAASDWIIDIGPGAGDHGGKIVAEGTPVELQKNHDSKTAAFLRAHLNGKI